MKKQLMVHELNEYYFNNINFEEYNLTFDDGLYSQFFYLPILDKIKTSKIFFISTGLIRNGLIRPQFNGKYFDFPTCYEAMCNWVNNEDREPYMNTNEIKWMFDNGYKLGGHGHFHLRYFGTKLVDSVNRIKKDIEQMLEWFECNLKFKPDSYCLPFNIEHTLIRTILKSYDMHTIYDGSRINIEDII